MINKIKHFIKLLKNKFSKNSSINNSSQGEENSREEISGTSERLDLSQIHHFTLWDKIKNFLSEIKLKLDGRRFKPFNFKISNSSSIQWTIFSPKINQFLDKALQSSSRTTIHQLSLIILISTFTYGVGKITFLLLKGNPTLESVSDYNSSIELDKMFQLHTLSQLKSANIFKTNSGVGPKNIGAEIKCETAQSVSNLPIKLVNTIVMQDSVKSIASVQVRGGKLLDQFREGEQISTMAKLFKIDRLEILVRNLENGSCESITSEKMKTIRPGQHISVMSSKEAKDFLKNKKISGIENNGNKFKISKSLMDEKLKDLAAILSQARAIKIQNPDGTLSFKLTEMDPEGIFPYLGLQDEDIITSINGKPILDMNEIMGLFAKIKNLDNLSLGVRRDGSDSVQEYSIKK